MKRCGKTRLVVDVVGNLVPEPLVTVNVSVAALVHSINPACPPTIVMDETDTVFTGGKPDERTELLRGILNSGFTRGAPYIRWDVQARARDECQTFAMAVLSGIDNGRMPDTIEDRAVIINLRRKGPAETVARFRTRRDSPKVREVGDLLRAWVTPNARKLGDATPDMPEELNDRAQDVWEPLLAVADLAGGTWPSRGRHAALALSGAAEEAASDSQRFLSDLRDVFGDSEAMSTSAIIAGLRKVDEAPWVHYYGHDRPLDSRGLAKLLKPYGLRSHTVRIGESTPKGYYRQDFADTWDRYLAPLAGGVCDTSDTSDTSQVNPVADENGYPTQATQDPPHGECGGNCGGCVGRVSDGISPLTCNVADVADVSDTPPASGHIPEEDAGPPGGTVTHGDSHPLPDWPVLTGKAATEAPGASANGHKPGTVTEEW
jgi:hypothetical protein